jgi:hypothetical protein
MIQINILVHSTKRMLFTSKSLDFLMKIKDENKKKIKLLIHVTNLSDINFWTDKLNSILACGIDAKIECSTFDNIYNNTYNSKIQQSIETNCEYSCSMDDDIMMSNYLWDYMIENISILDDPKNLFLSPVISNGIPSVDMFIQDFCNIDETTIMHDIFNTTHISDMWGVDYSSLNYPKSEWNLEFYEQVRKLQHYYKGIHPMRVSVQAHVEMAKIICNKYEELFNKNNYNIQYYKFPYFCNSIYFIKTDIWKRVINDKTLYRDLYDEVPLNLYRENHNLNMAFVRKGFCIHMAYNTIGKGNQECVENYIMNTLLPKL